MRPGKVSQKLLGYLYPSDFLALLGCKTIPIGRRFLYALATYTGLRKGSLYALRWSGVDFQNRTLTTLHSKTGLPQLFEIPPSLAALLADWFEHEGRPKAGAAVVTGVDCIEEREAEALRDDLRAAGVTRSALLEFKDNVHALRFHDLRTTFVTWAMREGRGDGWIGDRTGHLTTKMRERYARAARTLADLNYAPFPDISRAIPELLERRDNIVSLNAARGRR
jgi:integrase